MSSKFRSFGGAIFISNPIIRNSTFAKSVVFIGTHSSNETTGIIINKPQNKVLSHISKQFAKSPICDIPVYYGGNKNEHHLTITSWAIDRTSMAVDISYMLGMEETLEMMASKTLPQLRGYLGYIDWKPGELESQIKNNFWTMIDTKDLITSHEHGENLWYELAKKYFSRYTMICALNQDISESIYKNFQN